MPVPGAAQQHSRLKRRTVLVLAMFGFSAVSTVYSLSRAATLWQLDRKVGRFGDPDRAVNAFQPGEIWYDSDGRVIQAHGGCILYHQGVYYWYGENKAGPTYMGFTLGYSTARVDIIGINVYSSLDLIHWKNAGLALKAHSHPDLASQRVAERPKVVYNAATRQFVMWLHIDTADYEMARTGVATSRSPTGPFQYVRSFRPHGQQSRDMTVFQDDDGKAYLAYASEDNAVMHTSELTPDYLDVRPDYARVMVGMKREAPAVFKYGGTYFMLTSGCTGWDPNSAEVFYAASMLGEWRSLGNPCTGSTELDRAFTYFAQPTHVLPLPGRPGQYVFMADQWDSHNLAASRYVWLPLWVLAVPPAVQKVVQQREAQGSRSNRPAGAKPVLPASSIDVVVRWHATWKLDVLQDVPASRYLEQVGL